MITIEPYSKHWEKAHFLFASKYWTKRRRRESEYIYWKFRGNHSERLTSFILAIEDGKVIGQLGLIPCKINVDNLIYDAQWACDLMVDTDYRGKNIAAQLYQFAHSLKPITLGSDPSPAASKSMKRSGYNSLKGSWKHLFPIKLGEITKLKGYNFEILNLIYNPLVVLFFILSKFKNNSFDKIELNEYNTLLYRKKSLDTISVYRDSEFIDWRFNAFKDYYPEMEIYSKNDKKVFYLGYFANKDYFITDLNVNNIFELFQVISNIIKRYKNKNISRIRFCCHQENISIKLLFFGFIKFRTRTEVIYYSEDSALIKKMYDKKFYYTYMDSDENI